MATDFVLPGEVINKSSLPTPRNPSKALRVGPGLQQLSNSRIRSAVAGTLVTDSKKNAVWVESPNGRYVPTLNDPVVATVQRSAAEAFLCTLSAHSPPAQLPHLAFEGVSKKTRPQLAGGTLVYARVTAVPGVAATASSSSSSSSGGPAALAVEEPEIGCVNPSTGKGEGLGELRGGMVFDVSLGFARRLLYARQRERGAVAVLDDLAEKLPFEVAVGKNGRVWVNAEGSSGGGGTGVRETLLVGTALQETDRRQLGLEEQRKLVKRLLKSLV